MKIHDNTKQAVDLFFKTEDESKLLEIAEWE